MNQSSRFLHFSFCIGWMLTGCGMTTGDANQTVVDAAADSTVISGDETVLEFSGLDVSHFQGDVDWENVVAAGKKFAYCKATEGSSVKDPQFTQNWVAIKQAGMVRGAYHFFDPKVDARKQAEHFISVVTLEPGDLIPVLDIEVEQGQNPAKIDAEVQLWLSIVEDHYGVKPMIYSDYSFLLRDLPKGFCDYPLWLAAYEEKAPTSVACWDHWNIWQYSDTGQVSGINGNVDMDKYTGTEKDWKRLLLQ